MTKLRLSPTKMMAWDECPRKLKDMLTGERDRPTIYTEIGTAAHTVLELINKGEKMSPDVRELRLKEELIKRCVIADIPLMFTEGYQKTKKAIREYAIPPGYVVYNAERKFVLNFELYDFSFIIDVVFVNHEKKHIRIRDYKTGSSPGKPMQLWLYAWAVRILFPELAEYSMSAEFDMLQKGKLVEVSVDENVLASVQKMMDSSVPNILKCIKLNFWPEDASKGGCFFCSYKDCPTRPNGDD